MNFEQPIDDGKRDILDGANDPRRDPMFGDNIGYIPFAYHLLPLRGLAKAAAAMRCGERLKRGPRDWDTLPVPELLNHAISHIIAYLEGRRDDTHLANAACRVLMALELNTNERLPQPQFQPTSAPLVQPTSAPPGQDVQWIPWVQEDPPPRAYDVSETGEPLSRRCPIEGGWGNDNV